MTPKTCILVGAPVQSGASQPGCIMGPDAFRTAGLAPTLEALGHTVVDHGNAAITHGPDVSHPNSSVHDLSETVAWATTLREAAFRACQSGDLPIFLGGDHSLSIGTVPGVSQHSEALGKEQFVLWLDAHPDIHTLDSTQSGNLHGTPVSYFTGQPGFEKVYPELSKAVPPQNVCMIGIRSVDPAERTFLSDLGVDVHDMRSIDEHGIRRPLKAFLERVEAANGALHVSLDVDFLDPEIAPAVGTTVPGGATFREAHLVMEMLCDSGLVGSLDLVELNPFLDERGRTAKLMVDLCASLLGRQVLDRKTRSY
ncbi:arginase [uncultured Litoreibacter sp.]|uniref:arginase n=1 Tax=uncultured Litoreibacter sp. TaxID=1392394 RepID=UPI00262D0FD1|nr:arginase [uncultured Litoreibacter sp.]